MRVLRYWKKVVLKHMPFHASYDLVGKSEINDDKSTGMIFDAILRAVREDSDFDYELLEVVTTPVEARQDGRTLKGEELLETA